jgi:hypothetical protein
VSEEPSHSSSCDANPCDARTRDDGTILVLVLIVTILLSLVVVGMANYSSSLINYGQVSEARADRLSAADGAMRDALEKMRLSRSLCMTELGDDLGGYGTTFPETINGATAVVTCERVSVEIDAVQAWAIVVTGEGVSSSNTSFTASQGGGVAKKIGGPVYIHDPAKISLSVPVQIVEGDIFYTNATCPTEGASTDIGDSIAELTFEPADTRGTICTRRTWQEIFGDGPTIPSLTETVAFPRRTSTSYTTVGSCRVFEPGIYDTMPSLTTSGGNYFKSGKYLFQGVVFTTDHVQQVVTAGTADTTANIAQAIPNPACDAARDADAASTTVRGATFYMDGGSRILVSKGALEILGAQRGNAWVAVQALSTSNRSAENNAIISTANGENKEFAAQGMVWAPRARIELGNVTNRSVVQLHGGAVVAKFHIGANASINSYVIEVPSSPLTQTLMLTSTATKDGSTSIRAMVEYRAPREVAVKSWRIINT